MSIHMEAKSGNRLKQLRMRNTDKVYRSLAAADLILGVAVLCLDVTGLVLDLAKYDVITQVGGGIWSGALFVATGACGILALDQKQLAPTKKQFFTAFMILSMFSWAATVGIITVSAVTSTSCQVATLTLLDDASSQCNLSKTLRLASIVIYGTLLLIIKLTLIFGCCHITCQTGQVSSDDKPVIHRRSMRVAPNTSQGPNQTEVQSHLIHGNPAYVENSTPDCPPPISQTRWKYGVQEPVSSTYSFLEFKTETGTPGTEEQHLIGSP